MDKPNVQKMLLGGVRKPERNYSGRDSYFRIREEKLAAQAPSAKSSILRGCTFYFTGLKSRSQMTLSRRVWRHGGFVLTMWRRRAVTHVVCDNLAGGKIEKEISQRGSPSAWRGVVVRPEWVEDSLKKGKMLPTREYRVIQEDTTKDIRSFFTLKKPAKKINGTAPHKKL